MIDIWICTTHLQPPHATYVAWKWLAYITHCHTSCLDIIVISIKTSRQSQNLQNWTNNLSADWKCMDNLILSWFFSLQFLVLALPDWNSTGTVRWYCVEACISLENSILGILWLRVLITEKRQLVCRLIWHFDIEVLFISVWTVSCVCVWVIIQRSPSTLNARRWNCTLLLSIFKTVYKSHHES